MKLPDCHFFPHPYKAHVTSAVVSRHVQFKSPPSIRDSSGIHLSRVFVSIVKTIVWRKPTEAESAMFIVNPVRWQQSRLRNIFIYSGLCCFLYLNPPGDTETCVAPGMFSGNSLQVKSCVLACIWMQQNGTAVLSLSDLLRFLCINPPWDTETFVAQGMFSGNSLQVKSCVLACI